MNITLSVRNLVIAVTLLVVTSLTLPVDSVAAATTLPDRYSCSIKVMAPHRNATVQSELKVSGELTQRPSAITDNKIKLTLIDEVGTTIDQEEVDLGEGVSRPSLTRKVVNAYEGTLAFDSPRTKRGKVIVEHIASVKIDDSTSQTQTLCKREQKIFFSPEYIDNTIVISNPQPNQRMSSPFLIRGFATPAWFKYTRLRVQLHDEYGNIIGRGRAVKRDLPRPWTGFAPDNLQYFELNLRWRKKPPTNKGTLLFYSTNIYNERFVYTMPVTF